MGLAGVGISCIAYSLVLSTWRFMGSYKWGYISGVTIVVAHIKGLITPFITTHEPPSSVVGFWGWVQFSTFWSYDLSRRTSALR